MVAGKLVAVLEDVELQLQKVTLAVKLHLQMLRKGPQSPPVQSRESRDQLVALSKSIEAMQSELCTVTSEILDFAAKSLAVDTSEIISAGEETETEDEMEFEEEEKATVPMHDEAAVLREEGPIPLKVKSEPQQQPTTGSTKPSDCIVNVKLNTDAIEAGGSTHGESGRIDSDSKKRRRLSLGSDDREVKRSSAGGVTGVVDRYAKLAVCTVRQLKGDPLVAPSETSCLKQTTTETNAAVLEFLEAGQPFDKATSSTFCAATKHAVHIICNISKGLVECSWIEGAINGITNIARLVVGDAMMEHHDELLKCASRLRRHLIKNYGYASYQEDDEGLDAIEERVEWYRRDARQLKPKAIARPIHSITTRLVNDLASLESKGFVRTEENWERFTALGGLVAEWMAVAKGSSKAKTHAKSFRGLLQQLINLDEKYPGRLPSALLRNTKRLS